MREFEQHEIEWLTEAGVDVHDDIPAEIQRSLYEGDILKYGPNGEQVVALSEHLNNLYLSNTNAVRTELAELQEFLNLSKLIPTHLSEDSQAAAWKLQENIHELCRVIVQPFNPSYDRDSLALVSKQRDAVLGLLWLASGKSGLTKKQERAWNTLLSDSTNLWVPLNQNSSLSVSA